MPEEKQLKGIDLAAIDVTPKVEVSSVAKYEHEAFVKKHKRDEKTKDHLHYASVVFIWVAFLTFIVVFFIRVLHFVLPESAQWMSDDQVQGIDKLIFSGAIGGFIGRYFKRFNEPE